MPADFSAAEKKAEMQRLALALPLHFCDPVIIGRPPGAAGTFGPSVFSATVTYLELGGRKIILTNAHVVRHAQEERNRDGGLTVFQIPGKTIRDLDERIIDIDDGSDLANLDVSDVTLTPRDVPQEERKPRQFYQPDHWPPDSVGEQDVVAYAGWPGALRKDSADGWDIESNPYSMIGMTVTRAMPDRFNVKTDRSDITLVNAFGRTEEDEKDYDFGGMSGGPVLRRTPLHYELVGIIQQYNKTVDQFTFTAAENIKRDGTLWHNTRR